MDAISANQALVDPNAFHNHPYPALMDVVIEDSPSLITFLLYESKDDSEAKSSFVMHENLARSSSTFLEIAIENTWIDTQEKTVELYGFKTEPFTVFYNWVHTQQLPVSFGPQRDVSAQLQDLDLVLTAYSLGEKLHAMDFKDALLDAYCWFCRSFEPYSNYIILGPPIQIGWVWSETPPASKIHELLLDCINYNGGEPSLCEEQVELFSQDFLRAVAQETYSKPGPEAVRHKPIMHPDPCHYHEHGQENNCYKARLF
ncbi:hypothetical protein EJ05DRAFT_501419 [Pseudovirgaria hyperparasitica]|uniref:BTB domain-containing protein n=1 Tax=Pseudovirgaria hyperparasitica TaxID=470096 RepID=A0A6A6W2S8_9PEZI|nr:uncharacterized protein EJ05DRAFT_501419 [Pseudovirgaria hyperparasitica]KAF2756865.1 hypothetical protein EJ05DRAFT_501419 [Pseudovirgaria hyperparasitica]